jgi:serine/threonine protein kinase/Tfp pilus assembly protein PilF
MIAGTALNPPGDPRPAALPVTVRVPSDRYASARGGPPVSELPESAVAELCQARPEFELVARLGEGAFGRVYLARQHDLGGRLVALKVSTEGSGEARLLARLLHTNVVPIYSTHRVGHCHATCMPYLGSTTLADLIQEIRHSGVPESGQYLTSALQSRRGVCKPPDLMDGPEVKIPVQPPGTRALLDNLSGMSYVEAVTWIGQQLADGLAHAHERGIVHRDLKPANVLLTDEGQPMLLDFNLAEDVTTIERAQVGGTLPYLAPEMLNQMLGGPPASSPRSDLYSLGLILFELLTGRRPEPPFTGTTNECVQRLATIRSGPPPSLRDLNPAVTPALESIVQHCLEPDPARRYRGAEELREDLQRQREHLPLRFAREPSWAERARKWSRRHPRLSSLSTALALGSLLLLALGGAVWGYRARALRLEAEQALARLMEQATETHVHVAGLSTEDSEAADGQAREALAAYRALSDRHWRERPLARHLPEEKRARLEETVGSLLLVLARSERARAGALPPGEERDTRLRAALALNAQAERNGAARLPRALLLQRAELLRLKGAEDEARACREQAAQEPARGAADAFAAALEMVSQGKHRQALEALEEATRLAPQDAAAWLLTGRCQEALGLDRDAIASYTTAVALRPKTAEAHFRRGLAYFRLNDNPQALADFTKAIELGHPAPDAHVNRGLILHRLGRNQEALGEIDRSLELEAPYTRIYFIRSRIREKLGDRDGAKRDRDEGLKREPSDEQSWLARGVARLGWDDRGALADFRRAIDVNPRSLAAHVNAAYVLAERQGKTKEALEVLDRAVAHHPDHALTRATRGVLLARLGRRAEALVDAEQVRATCDAAVLFQLGALYAQTSRTEPKDGAEALKLLKRALRKGHGHDRLGGADFVPLRQTPEFQRLTGAAQGLL